MSDAANPRDATQSTASIQAGTSNAVLIRGLRWRYPGGDFSLGVDELRIASGEHVALIGPSGCGKSTLAGLIAGLLVPQSGEVTTLGIPVSTLGDARRRAFRAANIGFVFQEFELLDYLSAEENIILPYRICRTLTLTSEVRQRARDLAAGVGVGARLAHRPGSLSQGERQRVALCRALVTQPRLVIADEPTGNLDPNRAQDSLALMLQQVRASGATLLTVTHNHDLLGHFHRTINMPYLVGA